MIASVFAETGQLRVLLRFQLCKKSMLKLLKTKSFAFCFFSQHNSRLYLQIDKKWLFAEPVTERQHTGARREGLQNELLQD